MKFDKAAIGNARNVLKAKAVYDATPKTLAGFMNAEMPVMGELSATQWKTRIDHAEQIMAVYESLKEHARQEVECDNTATEYTVDGGPPVEEYFSNEDPQVE